MTQQTETNEPLRKETEQQEPQKDSEQLKSIYKITGELLLHPDYQEAAPMMSLTLLLQWWERLGLCSLSYILLVLCSV